MSNKNQTAVQLLLSELQIRLLKIKSEPNGLVRETMINSFLIDTEQSVEIEKQQIIIFADKYDAYVVQGGTLTTEQYYKETYEQ
jgi:hypothetical protein